MGQEHPRASSPDRDELLRRMLQEEGLAPAKTGNVAKSSGGRLSDERKEEVRGFYNDISDLLDGSGFGRSSFFLNLGYVSDDTPDRAPATITDAVVDRNSINLVLETVDDAILAGARVLDVGCGRGGTALALGRYCGVDRVVGMDLSDVATTFCGRTHGSAARLFVNGDAENLPFADHTFDAVTNIESSHSYPHADDFYREVARVLRQGGQFLYADVFSGSEREIRLEWLRSSGLALELDRDITSNVVKSCHLTSERRPEAFGETGEMGLMKDFMAAPGSIILDALESGAASFRILRLRNQTAVR